MKLNNEKHNAVFYNDLRSQVTAATQAAVKQTDLAWAEGCCITFIMLHAEKRLNTRNLSIISSISHSLSFWCQTIGCHPLRILCLLSTHSLKKTTLTVYLPHITKDDFNVPIWKPSSNNDCPYDILHLWNFTSFAALYHAFSLTVFLITCLVHSVSINV